MLQGATSSSRKTNSTVGVTLRNQSGVRKGNRIVSYTQQRPRRGGPHIRPVCVCVHGDTAPYQHTLKNVTNFKKKNGGGGGGGEREK